MNDLLWLASTSPWAWTGRGLLGLAILLGLAWLISENRRQIPWRLVAGGVLLQLLLAVLVLRVPGFRDAFQWFAGLVIRLLDHGSAGARFLFGPLAEDGGGGLGYIFAVQVLPSIIFFSALSSLLFYLGIVQKIVGAMAWVMQRSMRLSGVESLGAAANVFVGQTEAPLLLRPYLKGMNRSEIMTLMTGGMATIAGGVLVAYIGMLGGGDPEARQAFATALMCASLMSAPAAVVMAKIMVPGPPRPVDSERPHIPRTEAGINALDAIVRGTSQGLLLAVNVGAVLIVFVALVALLNDGLGQAGAATGLDALVERLSGGTFDRLSLEALFGFLFAPLAWIIGVPAGDLLQAGRLLGEKTVLNEFVAYASLAELSAAGELQPRTVTLATYALCGFANFASVGIQIGGISVICRSQRANLCTLGLRALVGGTLACLMTAAIVGLLQAA